jgi:O-antigen/teichoic acid export membrane protein/peptidoglycan/xylan/chitin deacetylase (PgdA/CDA1 family)
MNTITNTIIGRRAIGISFATQYVEMGIQFLSVMILARVLSPSEIGTFSLAAMLMTMLHVFRDFGVAQYVIQERELTPEKMQSTMGVAILLALFAGAVLFGLSGPVARFYDNPELRDVMLVMSGSFVISPFGSLLLGILRRENKLAAIFYVKTASALCHVAVAVGLALNGAGAISLAWANFAGILAFGVVGNLFRPVGVPWLPRFINMRKILSFGSVSSLGTLANVAGASAPELMIGKIMSMAAVGYFSRATGLVQLFTRLIANALTPLILPYFAQMRREDQPLAQPYLLAVSQLTAVAWPFFSVLLVLAYPVTRALYGYHWDASVPVARLMCLGGAIAALGLFASQAMIAAEQVRSSTLCNLIVQPLRIAAVAAAAAYGLLAIAFALLLAEIATLLVTCWFLNRTIGVTMTGILRACLKSAVITACSLVVPVMVWLAGSDEPAHTWTGLVAGGLGATLGWLGGLALTRHPLGDHILPALGLRSKGKMERVSATGTIKQLVYGTGLLGAWHRVRNRDKLTVAMFHRVLPVTDPRHAGADPEWTMTPTSFAQCLEFFRRHYTVVTPDQVFAALRGEGKLPPCSLLITFDDGWADTAEYAQPVLDRFGMPALVFVAGGAINRAQPFWEELVFSFLATHPGALALLEQTMERLGMPPLGIDPGRSCDEATIRAVIRDLSQRDRNTVLALADALPNNDAAPAMMDTAQLLALAAAGHTVGGHGMTHQPLTRVEALEQEMRAAQESVAQMLHVASIDSMSMPHGANSQAVIKECRAAGYRYLFNSESHLNKLDGGSTEAPLGPVGRIHIPEREITGGSGRVQPTLLATWLFLRAAKQVPSSSAGAQS